MTKLSIYLAVTTGSLLIYVDLPLHFLFGLVFVGIMIELDKIEKMTYPIISNLILSSLTGWAVSFGVKYYFPEFFIGEIKIFTIFITTIFAYVSIIYLLKNETIQKFINKKFK